MTVRFAPCAFRLIFKRLRRDLNDDGVRRTVRIVCAGVKSFGDAVVSFPRRTRRKCRRERADGKARASGGGGDDGGSLGRRRGQMDFPRHRFGRTSDGRPENFQNTPGLSHPRITRTRRLRRSVTAHPFRDGRRREIAGSAGRQSARGRMPLCIK